MVNLLFFGKFFFKAKADVEVLQYDNLRQPCHNKLLWPTVKFYDVRQEKPVECAIKMQFEQLVRKTPLAMKNPEKRGENVVKWDFVINFHRKFVESKQSLLHTPIYCVPPFATPQCGYRARRKCYHLRQHSSLLCNCNKNEKWNFACRNDSNMLRFYQSMTSIRIYCQWNNQAYLSEAWQLSYVVHVQI